MDVGAMRDGVRIAEALREARVERDVDHLLAGHAVHHQQALDEHRFLLHELADAERIERVPGVGGDLDAGADLAELRRLLEHHALESLARERQRGGEAADAAAGDDHRAFVSRGGWRCHRAHLPSSPGRCACARSGMYRPRAAGGARPARRRAAVSRCGTRPG